MVSVVAHNIRNPVAGIRATAQTCMREFEPGSATHRQQERIIKAVDSLEQWLKELVHVNLPIELTLKDTSIDELIADLQQIFQPASQRKNVSIDYAPSRAHLQVPVDHRHFVQAIASILDNAIQAAPTGSAVDIRTGRAGECGDRFFIEISDSGSGVAENLRKKIFEPHFSTKAGGTGIGLSMAQKIIEAHSGRLSLVACNGQTSDAAGATFRIEIPIDSMAHKADSPHG
jgi:signal transduction histidine kinase